MKKQKISAKKQTLYKTNKQKEPNGKNTITKKNSTDGSGRSGDDGAFELQDAQQSSPHLKEREKRGMKGIRPIAIINSTSVGF